MILKDKRPATITAADNIKIFLGNVRGLFEEAYIGGVPAAVREKYFYSLLCLFIGALLQRCMIMVKDRVNTRKKWPGFHNIHPTKYDIFLPPDIILFFRHLEDASIVSM